MVGPVSRKRVTGSNTKFGSTEAGALLIVDNTLLTPALQRPFEFGADVVLHSTTKFIEGHNATVGGALMTVCGRAKAEALRHSGRDPAADKAEVQEAGWH